MDNLGTVKKKLEGFIRKYYINESIKGLIFFMAIGLLYFLIMLFIETLLWLNPLGRSILFWSFVVVEISLFVRFIAFPVLRLFKMSRGLTYSEASRIIGEHFPEVNDKLLNLLQLNENSRKSDLLIAGIDQKAAELKPVPFSLAIDFTKSLAFLKYAAVPVLIIVLILISGRTRMFSDSYERVVNYKMAYEPPAPFSFHLENKNLKVRENEKLKLRVQTRGSVIPANISILYDGEIYFLEQKIPGLFEYTFEPARENFTFRLTGNKVVSRDYHVEVIRVPKMKEFRMLLDFPEYTGLKSRSVEGTGNALIPEGTTVLWEINTAATERVEMRVGEEVEDFRRKGDRFFMERELKQDLQYGITTSNENLQDYERLSYELAVIEDEYPKLELQTKLDSSQTDSQHFYGKASDDYGISAIKLVYYESQDEEAKNVVNLLNTRVNIAEFFTSFPDSLPLVEGTDYSFYFEVADNDAVNGKKKTRSSIFSYRHKTADEKKDLRLEEAEKAIQNISNSLENFKTSEKELEELKRLQKEKSQLNYNDRKRLQNFLERQKQQNEMMEKFNEKLKRNFEEERQPQDKDFKKELERRVEKSDQELQENEKLLEELEKYSDKIQEENLSKKLEDLSRKAKSRERNLEQLLELTKKYYVQEKTQKLANELQKLGEQQENLSEAEEKNIEAAQDSLTKKTKETLEEVRELQKENEALKKPIDLGRDEDAEEDIKEEQENAAEELKSGNRKGARKEQKKAAEKLRKMGEKMQQGMQSGGMAQMQEDAEMLRKVLDNLVTFSFEQEALMEQFKKMGASNSGYAGKLRRQDVLREHFEHIDDSLYALGLRNPMINEIVTRKLGDVDYSLEQALKRLAENQVHQGVGSQQYVITGANDLAYLLSEALKNMEESMSGGGQGKGMQLPDIIKKQKELTEGMEKGGKKKQRENNEEGEEGGKNKGESEEDSGKLFRIFQEQQLLRKALEEQLKKQGDESGGKELLREMKQVEDRMLEKGFDAETYRRMQQLEHKLLDLEDAELRQGRKDERESNTNRTSFSNQIDKPVIQAKEYFKTTEILNRQALPLRQIYKKKVKEYFERTEH